MDVGELAAAAQGNHTACSATELLPLVYEQLRGLARRTMRSAVFDQTLQATALVHEAYLRLTESGSVIVWGGRWHFYAAAAEAMRRILIDRARWRKRLKRGGAMTRVELDDEAVICEGRNPDLAALDEAISGLSQAHPEKARLVTLRFFGGLSIQEASHVMGISVATATRYWTFARAWLYREMSSDRRGQCGGATLRKGA
jgi:RNA polymerase sigma factor (TIGR02999 family)